MHDVLVDQGLAVDGSRSLSAPVDAAAAALGRHIGYDVQTSARRHGHATAMFAAALPAASALGVDSAVFVCVVTNLVAGCDRACVLADEVDSTLRFSVTTTPG